MNRERGALWQALGFAWQFGYTIAIPLVVFTLVGRLLDRRLGTHPWLLLTGVILAIAVSTTALIVRANRLMSTLQNTDPSKTKRNDGNLPRR